MMSNPFELNKNELYLSNIQQSWADAANNWRMIEVRSERIRRNKNNDVDAIACDDLLLLNEQLDVWHKEFEKGVPSALLWALRACMEQMLPPPYWVSDGFLSKLSELENKPVSLHDIFELNRVGLNSVGKRAVSERIKNRNSAKLWWNVQLLMQKSKCSKEMAIKEVKNKLNLPYSLGTTRTLYNKLDATQKKHRRARGIR